MRNTMLNWGRKAPDVPSFNTRADKPCWNGQTGQERGSEDDHAAVAGPTEAAPVRRPKHPA